MYSTYLLVLMNKGLICQSSDIFNLLHKSLLLFLLYAPIIGFEGFFDAGGGDFHTHLSKRPSALASCICSNSDFRVSFQGVRCQVEVQQRILWEEDSWYELCILSDTTECCSSLSSSPNSSLHSSVCKHRLLVPTQVPAICSDNIHNQTISCPSITMVLRYCIIIILLLTYITTSQITTSLVV